MSTSTSPSSARRAEAWRLYVQSVIGNERQRSVSGRANIDQGTVSRWLQPREGSPRAASITIENVRKFADAYGRKILEAFVAAGFLSEEEAGVRLDVRPLTDYDTEEFAVLFERVCAEAHRRLHHP